MGPRLRGDDSGIFWWPPFINIKFFIPYPRAQDLAYPARVLSDEGRF
jgi:hypothetical protein